MAFSVKNRLVYESSSGQCIGYVELDGSFAVLPPYLEVLQKTLKGPIKTCDIETLKEKCSK